MSENDEHASVHRVEDERLDDIIRPGQENISLNRGQGANKVRSTYFRNPDLCDARK